MKIGVNSRIYQNKNTGIPYYIKCLYTTLQSTDTENDYVFFQTEAYKTLGNTKVARVPKHHLGSLYFDLFSVHRMAMNEHVDIVHGPSHFLPYFKPKHMKYVVTIHDLFLLRFPELSSWSFRNVFRRVTGHSLNIADIVVADSHHTKKDVIEFYGIDEAKIKVVHLGLNDIFLHNRPTKRLVEDQYFFSLTTHPQRKNILRVLEIYGESKELQQFKYVIAGMISDDQLVVLREYIRRYHLEDKVILYGYVSEEDLVSLYQHAAFFIFPSFYEGFGLPVVEAMACNCPVITSSVSSLPELMPTNEWLVDPYDKESILTTINKILALSEHERQSLLMANHEFAMQFTWQRSAHQMMAIFNELGER